MPAEKGDTIGGLCFNTLERAPRKGEKITVPGYVIECIDDKISQCFTVHAWFSRLFKCQSPL